MAQASSVPAREPSMEEILASIRRIIEDSDGAQAPGSATAQAQPAPVADNQQEPAGAETVDGGSADLDAFRSELSAAEQEAVQDRTAAADAGFESAASHEFDQQPAADEEPQPYAAAEPQSASAEPGDQPEPAEVYEAPQARAEPQYDVPSHEAATGQSHARTSIISETASRQVAAAFEELQDAFASNQRRSFDEVAEELMRPMLQDWLDNNLPLLVERLVREEIERVARGATR